MSTLDKSRRRQDRIAALMPVIFLIALGAVAMWLDFTISRAVLERHKSAASAPEQFLESFVALRFEKDGAMSQKLDAARATYFPQFNRTVVEKPIFGSRQAGQAPLDVTAAKALVQGRNERIDFSGGVRAKQAAFNGQPSRVLETETLATVPATGELSTNSAVKMTQADTTVESNGLRVNSKTQQFSSQGSGRIILMPK